MSVSHLLEAHARLEKAVANLELQLTLLEDRLAEHQSSPAPVDQALVERHKSLKQDVAAVIAELDTMLGRPAQTGQDHG
jgi:hypothetical protein